MSDTSIIDSRLMSISIQSLQPEGGGEEERLV
jgi:hypothetical protein